MKVCIMLMQLVGAACCLSLLSKAALSVWRGLSWSGKWLYRHPCDKVPLNVENLLKWADSLAAAYRASRSTQREIAISDGPSPTHKPLPKPPHLQAFPSSGNLKHSSHLPVLHFTWDMPQPGHLQRAKALRQAQSGSTLVVGLA